jgi:tRNA threonylcarbamoyladenosine biosynthesis protein TsaB
VIVSIDTSTALTSVAITDGQVLIAERSQLDAHRHTEVLAPMLKDVLNDVGRTMLTTVAVGVGPGPYTGLRAGIATARALGFALRLPVLGLCSLDALAAEVAHLGAAAGDEFGVAGDARRREVYWAWYRGDGVRLDGPRVSQPTAIDSRYRGGRWYGSGSHEELLYPHASWVGRRVGHLLAAGVQVADIDPKLSDHSSDGAATSAALDTSLLLPARPLYLRHPDAQPSKSK